MGDLQGRKLTDICIKGIMDVYVSHAENHMSKHQASGTIQEISRAQVELDILRSLDEETFPIEMKVSWYHAILSSSLFDSIWRGAAVRLRLNDVNTARYTPDESQQDFKLPPGIDASVMEPASILKKKSSKSPYQRQSKVPRTPGNPLTPLPTSSPSQSPSSSSSSSPTTSGPTPAQMALAAKLGSAPPDPTFPSNHKLGKDSAYSVRRRSVGFLTPAQQGGMGRKSGAKRNVKFAKGAAAASSRKRVMTAKAMAALED